MTPRSARGILAFYPRGSPGLTFLLEEIGRHRTLRGVWPVDAMDMACWASGIVPPDPVGPLPLPKALWTDNRKSRLLTAMLRPLVTRSETVVFTRPDHAPLLPHFAKQQKIFYVIDDYRQYSRNWDGRDARNWDDQEIQLLAFSDRVIAISHALGEVLVQRLPSVAQKLIVSPNAVPAAWIPEACPVAAAPLPEGLRLPRPLAGVLGTISSRLRLAFLLEAARRTPFLHWLFVGNVEEGELHDSDRPILAELRAQPNCTFLGKRPYRTLASFAAALDVGIMPYSGASVNPLGSPMRLFLQLAYGQPILATPGCLAVEDYQPLVQMCADVNALVAACEDLRRANFDDGLRARRWEEARRNSWTVRAENIISQLAGASV